MAGDAAINHFFMVKDLRYIVYIVGTAVAALLLYSLVEAYRRWTFGGERVEWGPLGSRAGSLAKYALFQWRVVRHRFPGTLHLLIFLGMGWLFMATIIRALDLYLFISLLGRPLIGPDAFKVYKLLSNIAGAMVVVGSVLAIARRAAGLTPNLPRDPSYYAIHAGFIVIVVTGFVLDGIAATGRPPELESPLWDPLGYPIYEWAVRQSPDYLASIYRPLWLAHFLLAQAMLALIPFTNLWHIAASTLNVALARREAAPAAVRPVEDIDERVERGEPIGVVKLRDTTWKQRMDFEACTSCMRCTNACPAYATGKILDPMKVVTTLREKMLRDEWDDDVVGEDGDGRARVHPEAVWSCVTCGACVTECPVLIHHVELIIDLRRGMISTESEYVPEDAQNALYNLLQQGNPFGFNPADREEWIQRLAERYGDDVIAREEEEYDYIYWIGCVTSYDPRIRPVAESVIALLKRAGVKVAVLPEEGCCGEPARRLGEETLFVEVMKSTLENLSQYKFKKLLVSCPHGFNVFRNEYPKYKKYLEANEETRHLARFLDGLEVEHHSVVLDRLVREGRIKARSPLDVKVTYHDPCYLGRWNGVFEQPRRVLVGIPKLRLAEMPRNRARSFCCGGGGGHMFFEVKRGTRISRERAREAAGTGARVVAVACPFCNTMFRAEAENFGFEVRDIAELLRESAESLPARESK